jgi:DHA1 family tetracycline resistance protein-like MFS transporter
MPSSRSKLGVIFLTVFIDLMGFGFILPILPYYAQQFGAGGLGFGALLAIYSVMQFVATVVLGRLSDRVGRRPVLLTTITVGAVGYLLFAEAGGFWALFLARAISGFAGGNISVAQAYIADVTSPDERSKGMGIVGAAFGLGFVIGPALGGIAAHYGGPRAAGFAAAGLEIVNLISAWFILVESLGTEHRAARPLIDTQHLRQGLTDPKLRPAFLMFGLLPLAFTGYMIGLPLYAKEAFGWGSRELGWIFSVIGVVAAVVQGYLLGKLLRRTGNRTLILAGTVGMAIATAGMPFSPRAVVLYPWVVLLAASNGIAIPAITGLVSTLAGPSEQGATLGAAQALSAAGRLTGPLLWGGIYDWFGPKAAFLASAFMMLVAWAVGTRIRKDEPVGDRAAADVAEYGAAE